MIILFVDTNVLIDFLADRKPFSTSAAKLFNYAISGKIKIYISAISYNNIYYVLRKSLSANDTIELLKQLSEWTEIVDVTKNIIHKSLISDFKDFEDASQYNCALTVNDIQILVTRNVKDFKKSVIPIMTTEEAASLIQVSK